MARENTLQLQPRLLSRTEAAAYCGFTPSRFSQLQRHGTFPGPIPGTTRYDRVAIDKALDKFSGLTSDSGQSAYDRWKAGSGSRAP